jgi:adenylyltransferase/sulfurtransferase
VLHENQKQRYSRQLLLEEFSEEKQERLLGSKVLVIGAGGLGSTALLYLTACGIGNIGIADFDKVGLSDLNRQIIYTVKDVGKKKVISATKRLGMLNSDVKIIPHNTKLTEENSAGIIKDYDCVLECSDNLHTKLLVNDVCYFLRKPLVIAGILGFDGTLQLLGTGIEGCYRCLHSGRDEEDTHQKTAVIGMIPGMLGIIQALETMKFLANIGEVKRNRILYFSGFDTRFREFPLEKNQDCLLCGTQPTIDKKHYNIVLSDSAI